MYEMTMDVRFCLSYDPLKWNCVQNTYYLIGKCIIDTDTVNDITCLCQSVITHVVL